MEDLFNDNKLGQLEEKIEGLLRLYLELKEERTNLTDKVESLEQENRVLNEQIAKAESEKAIVMQKVKGILDKIEQIEV
jgi:peptidoglycan hydrolase CwlO-like protein